MLQDVKIATETLPSTEQSGPGGDRNSEVHRETIERRIVEVWEGILGVTGVRVDDNFFDLGGNSLSVIRFLSWVLETYHAEIPLTSFFEQPTVAEMALLVASFEDVAATGTPEQGWPR
ncbi:MAG: phosphopantetheine-binding protein [Isosphaeraceae bacterium]